MAIAQVWDDLQVIARAGSGKTLTIINRAVFLTEHCNVKPSEILILAFNRNAALEVSDRLVRLMRGKEAPQSMTFHALAWAIIHPSEEFLKDDEDSGWQKSRQIQFLIDDYIRSNESAIQELMIQYFRRDWDNIISKGYHLSPKEMVKHRRSLPYLGFDGYYYKSMGEKKIADYLFEHEVPYQYERNFWWKGRNYKPDFYIQLDKQDSIGIVFEYFGLIGDTDYDEQSADKRTFWKTKNDYLFQELNPSHINFLDRSIGVLLRQYHFPMHHLSDEEIWHRIRDREIDHFSKLVSQFIGRCRNALVSPEDLAKMANEKKSEYDDMVVSFLRIVWKIYNDYLSGLNVKGQEDFQGLVFKAAEAIEGGSYLWDRKEGFGDLSKLKYIFIDEYQDFSPLFYKLLSSVRNINPSAKVFCVGDDWQAINAFAGSDLKYFRNFKGYFHNGDVLSLTTNYRSSSDIVDLGNQVMKDEGIPSKTDKPPTGDIWCANIEEFKPIHAEEHGYKENMVTPALVRLIHSFIGNNRQVALLSRRKNGWPWYNPYGTRFRDMLLKTIREEFPENKRSMIKTIDSAHSFKGKEEDAIIIVDAVERSYPLIHPDNIFYQILGQTLEDVISDEKRLFYVAMSRAKSSLIFITGGNNISPFLRHINLNNIDWDKYQPPHRQGSKYLISITGNTFEIKELLKSHHFTWSPANQVWGKHIAADNFSEAALAEEPWFQRASGISISVHDEFDNIIYSTTKK